jgi:hypothetical protein
MLERLTIARAEQQALENNAQKLNTEQTLKNVLRSKNSTSDVTKEDYGSNRIGYRIKGEDGKSTLLSQQEFEQY